MLTIPIKFDDLLKVVDSLTPEQKQILRQRIDEVGWSKRLGNALDDIRADIPIDLSEEEIQADIESAIREVRSKTS